MGFCFAFRAPSKEYAQWHMGGLYRLGLCTVIPTYRLGNAFLKCYQVHGGSSLCISVSPAWNMQQSWDSPNILFIIKRGRLKEKKAPSIHSVLPVPSCDGVVHAEWIYIYTSIVWHWHLMPWRSWYRSPLQNEVSMSSTCGWTLLVHMLGYEM